MIPHNNENKLYYTKPTNLISLHVLVYIRGGQHEYFREPHR